MGAESDNRTLIFTYGTLKIGFPNHGLLQDLIRSGDALFIGPYRTHLKYPLVCGPYRVPFLINRPGYGHCIWGELYAVSGHALTRLDELEGTSRGHYERLPVVVRAGEEESDLVNAEAYYANSSYADGLWERCEEKGIFCYNEKEAKGYVKRIDRTPNTTFLDQIRVFVASSENLE